MGGYCYGVGGEVAGTGTEMRDCFGMIMVCSVFGFSCTFGVFAIGSYSGVWKKNHGCGVISSTEKESIRREVNMKNFKLQICVYSTVLRE